MIYIGIDDTDIIGTPGTNQLARAILKHLGRPAENAIICRHQLFFDPRVPYTSKNGSASIQLPRANSENLNQLKNIAREVMREWFVAGSDPGLCLAMAVPEDVRMFGIRCKADVVTQDMARRTAATGGCYLEGLGGTEQGIIGALAAVGLVAGGNDGRVVHLNSWPYPDESFVGAREIQQILDRGVDEIRELESDKEITSGPVDIGKHLRPNWRGSRIVLYVNAMSGNDGTCAPWRAVKLA